MSNAHDDLLDLGPCCHCGGTKRVRNLVDLGNRIPERYRSRDQVAFGCVVCHLPCEGAAAVLCDPCAEAGRRARYFIVGPMREHRRMTVELLTEPFEHDLTLHPEVEAGC